MTLLLASATASANLISNGDFATGILAGWTTFNTANGISDPAAASWDVSGAGASNSARFHVGEVSIVGSEAGGGICQNFSNAAGTVSVLPDTAASGTRDYVSFGLFKILIDGVSQSVFDYDDQISGTYRHAMAFNAVVTAGMHELRILITRPFPTDGNTPFDYVDKVVVDGAAPASVPEPGTLALGGFALAGMLLTGRHRRAQ